MAKESGKNNSATSTVGFEQKLWAAADALRFHMDAAVYKHVVLGLIFLNCISDAFEAKHAELEAEKIQGDCTVALPGQLFFSTQIPVWLWFLEKNKNAGGMSWRFVSRQNEVPSTLAA